VDELRELLDEARADDAAAARQRARWLSQADEDDASLLGTLIDLAERTSTVTVQTDVAGAHHGIVRLVGADFVVLGGDSGETWLSLSGVVVVRPHADERHGAAVGRQSGIDLGMAEALARIAPDRPRVALTLAGGVKLAGELRSVGRDVATLLVEGGARELAYVSLSSLRAVFRSG
jgi:hypothetical protein